MSQRNKENKDNSSWSEGGASPHAGGASESRNNFIQGLMDGIESKRGKMNTTKWPSRLLGSLHPS